MEVDRILDAPDHLHGASGPLGCALGSSRCLGWLQVYDFVSKSSFSVNNDMTKSLNYFTSRGFLKVKKNTKNRGFLFSRELDIKAMRFCGKFNKSFKTVVVTSNVLPI
jgi:hypothetical protein